MFEKYYIWNPATCSCEDSKYVGSIINDSVITYDEVIEETKTVATKIRFPINQKSGITYVFLLCKNQN